MKNEDDIEIEDFLVMFATASLLDRIKHCLMYLFKPSYILERYLKMMRENK